MADFPSPRFDSARIHGQLAVQDLWVRYLAVGGHGDMFDVDAHLHGVAPLTSFERDVLAYALNERLDEIYDTVRVPYLTPGRTPVVKDLEAAVNELLDDLELGNPPTESPSALTAEPPAPKDVHPDLPAATPDLPPAA